MLASVDVLNDNIFILSCQHFSTNIFWIFFPLFFDFISIFLQCFYILFQSSFRLLSTYFYILFFFAVFVVFCRADNEYISTLYFLCQLKFHFFQKLFLLTASSFSGCLVIKIYISWFICILLFLSNEKTDSYLARKQKIEIFLFFEPLEFSTKRRKSNA